MIEIHHIMQTLEFPTRSLMALSILTAILFLLFAVFIFTVNDDGIRKGAESLQSSGLKNFTITAQGVATIFWTALLLIAGLLWTRVLVRPHSLMESLIVSMVIGVVFINLSLFSALYLFETSSTTTQSALVILSLFLFIIIGLLLLILREVITAMFSHS